MGHHRIVSLERKGRRIEAQRKRQAVAKLARKPKEKNIAKRRQQLAKAQQRFREYNKKSSLEKIFTDSLDVICHLCERIFWRSTLKILLNSQTIAKLPPPFVPTIMKIKDNVAVKGYWKDLLRRRYFYRLWTYL